MTQHLLSNINLFYQHYQQEFEQLTKKYRLTFLERFIELIKKFQISQTKLNNIIQKIQPTISNRNSITHPPDILSMSSLSGSLATEKDRSETIPSNSISLSTTSNPSIIIGEKNKNRKYFPIQNSSSKKTFTLNRTGQRQSLSKIFYFEKKLNFLFNLIDKSKKQTSSSLQLIDAYRFRDTLRINNTHFSSPRPKIR